MDGESTVTDPVARKASILYHYTTQRGLVGILESKNIWATHAAFLNDSSEFRRGRDIVRSNLENLKASSLPTESEDGEFAAGAALAESILDRARGGLRIIDGLDVFVASFFDGAKWSAAGGGTDAGDALNQWRAYSGGEAGFSIGFDKDLLSQHIAAPSSDPLQWIEGDSCDYDETSQYEYLRERVGRFSSSIMQSLVAFLYAYAQELRPRIWEQLRSDSASAMASIDDLLGERVLDSGKEFGERMTNEFRRIDREIIKGLAEIMVRVAFMKHPAFVPENEWRIAFFLFRPASRVKFRSSASSLVPYVEIPLPLGDSNPNLIRRIVVGPTPRAEEALLATKMLLRCTGYKLSADGHDDGIEVVSSRLPFRSW